MVLVGRLCGASRDPVNIDIDGKISEALESLKTRLLPGFPQRHGEDVRVSIGMAPELKPAIEFSVVRQQETLAVLGDDPRRSRDMAGKATALKTVGAFANKFANSADTLDFTGVFAFVVG